MKSGEMIFMMSHEQLFCPPFLSLMRMGVPKWHTLAQLLVMGPATPELLAAVPGAEGELAVAVLWRARRQCRIV